MKPETMWNRLAENWDTPGVSLGDNDFKIIERRNISARALPSWTMDARQACAVFSRLLSDSLAIYDTI
jgi:hypothetical protein